jgi:formate hydrogenlyase subunit 3/multisubunit Na+/H+ antiporter MnhD subunit
MFATTQIAILLVVLLWWAPIGEIPRDSWQAIFAAGNGAAVVLATFWALRAGVAPLQTWLTPALIRSPGPRASILVLASLGVGGLLLIEVATFARQVWPGWTSTMMILGLVSVVTGTIRLLAQSRIHGAVTYLAVIQAGVLALAVASGAPTADLARSFALIATVGLVVTYISGTAIERLTDNDAFPAILVIVRREPLVALAAVFGLAITIGLPPFGTFDLRASLVQHLLESESELSQFARYLATVAIAASLAVPVLFLFRRLFGPDGEAQSKSGTLPASARFGLTGLTGFAIGLAYTTKTIGPPLGPAGIDWLSIGASTLLVGAVIIGFFLFLIDASTIGRRQPVLVAARGATRSLAKSGRVYQSAADRGLFDPLVRLPVVVIGVARAVAFTFDFLLGRLTRNRGE